MGVPVVWRWGVDRDRDLVEACRATVRREPFLYPGAINALIRDCLQRPRDGEEIREDPLTARESEIVKLIAQSDSSKQTAEMLRFRFGRRRLRFTPAIRLDMTAVREPRRRALVIERLTGARRCLGTEAATGRGKHRRRGSVTSPGRALVDLVFDAAAATAEAKTKRTVSVSSVPGETILVSHPR